MKKIILSLFCSCVVGFVWGSTLCDIPVSAVPAAVKEYVGKNYPKASKIEWDYEEDSDLYEVDFRIDDLEYELKLTPEGVLKYSKEDIRIKDIPAVIVQHIKKEYEGYKILGANKLFVKGKYIYDVGIKGKNAAGFTRHYNIRYDEKGNVLPEEDRDSE
ncbi:MULTISPECIES: PepSY-like domain-containing protein [Butyricimonas]|uniref:PepSY-like domain-containing protein n=1 Tax=Butyricimonas TaxID=574697 RepID=UPI0007FB578E|nr:MULTISPECIES: PepSY-like domain-containing protein [Butyricimonas]